MSNETVGATSSCTVTPARLACKEKLSAPNRGSKGFAGSRSTMFVPVPSLQRTSPSTDSPRSRNAP